MIVNVWGALLHSFIVGGWHLDIEAVKANALGTIVGGIFLTVVYFLLRERLFRPPGLAGAWILESDISQTKYNPFRGMTLRYKMLLRQNGTELRGTGEKVYEMSDKQRTFTGTNRTRVVLEGTIQKLYLSRSTVFLHAVEEGEQRPFSWVAETRCRRFGRRTHLSGRFSSTAGDASGIVVARRIPLPNRVDEYRGLSLGWFSRLIEIITAGSYRKEWEQLRAKVECLKVTGEEFWKTHNSHLLVAALVLAEDRRFYNHGGTDPIAICRATFSTVFQRKIQGGSTIEQQLVRHLISDYRRSLRRKLKEIILAVRLHRILQKDQIAVVYLVSAYFGWQMNGIRQAAQRLAIDLKNPTVEGASHLIARIRYPEPHHPSPQQSLAIAKRQERLVSELQTRMYLLY